MNIITKMLESERLQLFHRSFNTVMSIVVIILAVQAATPIYERISGLEAERIEAEAAVEELRIIDSEISQIVIDEGYSAKPYKDSLGKMTIGFGHLLVEGETFTTITPHDAVKLLRHDYSRASQSVSKLYPWAENDVKLVLINMTYQMGATGVSEFKMTIKHLKNGEYDLAAGEMLTSRWAMQTPSRASRLAGRIMALGG